jgi:aryl-alcohol dehydrogenase-like predicted oxidoreductase
VTAPILGARTAAQLAGALQVERIDLPAEIVRALDDVSGIEVGYPERDG